MKCNLPRKPLQIADNDFCVSKFHKQFNIYYLIYQSTAEAIIEQVYDQIQHV